MARGDQIYVFREFVTIEGVYQHHGIDCGDGSVIHYRKPSETVERTSADIFTRGERVYVRNYPAGFCFIADVVVKRAEARLGEREYNLLFNNCEHFATWCKTGVNHSKQVKDFIPAIAKINTNNLKEPLNRALQEAEPDKAKQLVNQALSEIEGVWNQIQPRYKKAIAEMETWEKVAWQAVKKNREDLARVALERKLNYKQRAAELKKELEQLATMTETLVRNSQTRQ